MGKITTKGYTDIKQSKKLAEFLPIESADMYYSKYNTIHANTLYGSCNIQDLNIREYIPAWSLAALIDVLPLGLDMHNITDGYKMYYYAEIYMKRSGKEIYLSTERHENLVDCCYEMILKLYESNLL